MDFIQFSAEKGFNLSYEFDGEFHRFDRNGSNNGWFVGRHYTLPSGKQVLDARFGDWRTGEKYEWRSEGEYTPEESLEITQLLADAKANEKLERQRTHEKVALSSEIFWMQLMSQGTTAYMERKLIKSLYGARILLEQSGPVLVVPARDIDGKLWGTQKILEDGAKYFAPGMRIKGCFHLIGEIKDGQPIYIAEGYSTAASIHLATGGAVASAFNAGNVPEVAQAIRGRYPSHSLIICGDDDVWKPRPDGTVYNAGRIKADLAAKLVGGIARYPVFQSPDGGPTDFNDLHVREGTLAVHAQLVEALATPEIGTLASGGDYELIDSIESLPVRVTDKGKPQPPTQQMVVNHLLQNYGHRLLKQGREDLFIYTGTHWKLLTEGETDAIKVRIQEACSGQVEVKFIQAVFTLLRMHLRCPPAGIDLFVPRPNCANFLNGTLHATLNRVTRQYDLTFHPHSPHDYLINVLPFEYRAGDKSENPEFLEMLGRVFQGDRDIEEKIRAVRQMYGACLMPLFPHLFMLHGPAGTGKSTVLKIAARLVHRDNLCSVPPSQMEKFNMETMAGKLVNLDTDIPLNDPLKDEIVKKIIDRQNFRIGRKNLKDLYAPIPPIHLFGGNAIPRTLDGASKAHDRRWTFLKFDAFVPKGVYDQEYHDFVFEQSPEGILNFALEGLRDLCESRGHFLNPESGRAAIAEWQLESDVVGTFFEEIRTGGVSDNNTLVMEKKELQIDRKHFWLVFVKWHEESYNSSPKISKNKFFATLRERKVAEKRVQGTDYWCGYGVGPGSGGNF